MSDEILFSNADLDEMIANSKSLVESLLGRTLQKSEPLYLYLCALLSIIYQQHVLLNENARQNLLRYATGTNLDCLGELVGCERLPAATATCTMELTLSAARAKETVIRAGTRFTTADNVHFALDNDVIFLVGETVKTAKASCLETGKIGNDYDVGAINQIVDYRAYLQSAKNITVSEGGADAEDDSSLRERIRLAPSSFSVAGSRQAYVFHAKEASKLVSDVYPISPVPGYVDVYILLENGEIPGDEILELVQDYLSDEKVRPLTDFVSVKPADIVNYDIDVKYWISRDDATSALAIKTAAEKAVQNFIDYQKSKLGRDLDPSILIHYLKLAGVNRIVVNQPEFQVVSENAVAIANNVNIEYRGMKTP